MRNWAGNISFHDAQTLTPTSVEELQKIVATNSLVRARGTAHSFNSIADTTGVGILLRELPQVIEVDSARSVVRVSGGLRYGDLAQSLHAKGFALHNLASLPHISIAGAIATGTHGSGVTNGSLSTEVRALDLVLADGDIRRLTREDLEDTFNAAVVGLGLLGIVSTLELDIEPTYQISQVVYPNFPRSLFYENLNDILGAAYSVSFFTTWGEKDDGQVWTKERTSQFAGERESELFGIPAASAKQHPIPGIDPIHCTEQLNQPGAWHERLPHFKLEFTPSAGDELQSEYLVPRSYAAQALAALESLSAEINELLQVSEIRTVKADNLWLSPGYEMDVVGIHFTWQKTDEIYQLLSRIEEVLANFQARPHWGKVYTYDRDYLASVYPKFSEFKALAETLDPTAKFQNEMTSEIFA
jgi:xylitol oxidase